MPDIYMIAVVVQIAALAAFVMGMGLAAGIDLQDLPERGTQKVRAAGSAFKRSVLEIEGRARAAVAERQVAHDLDHELRGNCRIGGPIAGSAVNAAAERALWKRIPPWNPPTECADISEATLERYRAYASRSYPGYSAAQREWIARTLAMDNLQARTDFRREIAEYTHRA